MKNKLVTAVSLLLIICMAATAAAILTLGPVRMLKSIFPDYETEPALEPLNEIISEPDAPEIKEDSPPVSSSDEIIITLNNIFTFKSFDIIRKNLYNIDKTAYIYDDELDFKKLLSIDTSVDLYGEKPKILIFHTHSQEGFSDSRDNIEEDTIVGVGAVLAEILTDKYGVSVIHDKGVYDMDDGKVVRGGSYEKMEESVRRILEENPSIEIMIDLHRDSLPNGRLLMTEINGNKTAQIMFFNGICKLNENGLPVPTENLSNEYIAENLALSLKTKLLANELYPGFTRKNYIKPYRYSLHMKPNSLLIEVGSDTNTVNEAKNAMFPLADILIRAFS